MEKNLGHATAYGYAKSKGYTGTEEEFSVLMASYATVAEEAAESAENASQSAESASASAQTATSKASEASTSATQAGASATSASQSASTATTKAQEASASALASEQSANSASASATTAQTKANEASISAQTATENANTATTKASEASTSASESAQSASSASLSASTASTKASEASESATIASTKASEASESATTATTKASEASASASTASTKASEASTSASTASSKASEASASATSAQTAQGLAESARDDAIDAKTDAETARDMAQQYAESINPDNIYSAYPTDTASGAVATFTDGADDIPMKSVKVAIEPVQSGSGDPSPDNVRPISGWTGAQVSHSGADRTNPTTYSITFPTEAGTVYGGELDVTNGVLTVDRACMEITRATVKSSYTSTYGGCAITLSGGALINADDPSTQVTADSMVVNTRRGNTNGVGATFIVKTWSGKTGVDAAQLIFCGTWGNITEFNTWLDTNTIHVCYPIATPITYTLTPTEIKSLLGDNNVWADCGDTEVTYRADTKLYINKKIAEVINTLS